jgi:hypothetical protein
MEVLQMSKSDVRIVTSKNGFEVLKSFVENYIKENSKENDIRNLLEKFDLKYENSKQCYFGWNELSNWSEYFNKSISAIMDGLRELENNDYSYRFYRLGEDKEDYDEHHFDADREGEQDLEYPNITREFDDRYICDIIHRQKQLEESKEDIEI